MSSERRTSKWLAVPLVLGFSPWWGAIGCNNIVGIEPAQLDTGVGGSTSGSGGGGSPEPKCSDFTTTDANLVRGCVLRLACDPLRPYYSMSDCVGYAYQLANPYEACTYGVESCADVEECLGRRRVDPDSCSELGWSCNGNEAIRCRTDEAYVLDCSTVGSTCSRPDGFPDTTLAPCVASDAPCETEAGAWHCEGNMLYTCVDGVRYGQDCSLLSGTCVESTPGQGTCIDSSTRCTNLGALTCNGNVLTFCSTSGIRAVLDCGTAGLRCEDDGYVDCVAPGCTLDDVAACTEGCDGTVLRYCVGGSPQSVDCTDFGFASCEQWESDGRTNARCSPNVPGAGSCRFAQDGECDEPTLCDPGTDTTDCATTPM